MLSTRRQIELIFSNLNAPVAVLPPHQSHTVGIYPVVLGNVDARAVMKHERELAGRLNVPSCRIAWAAEQTLEIEIPRAKRETLTYQQLQVDSEAAIPWLLGATRKHALVTDLATAPHMLVTGTTGAGKSNATIASLCHLVETRTPQQIRLVISDLKEVDLLPFKTVPHTLSHETEAMPILNQAKQLEFEMKRRYTLMSTYSQQNGVPIKNLAAYNKSAKKTLPYVVFVIDELGGLMTIRKKLELEDGSHVPYAAALTESLQNLLQLARACGIHLVIGIQRPGASSIDPQLRENLAVRIAFKTIDASSSQLAVGDNSAMGLMGDGDGILRADGKLTRFQAPYADDTTLEAVLAKARNYKTDDYALPQLQQRDQVAQPEPIHEGKDPLQASIDEVKRHRWVNSGTLIDAGIFRGETTAKKMLRRLRKMKIIGENDASRKASPVLVGAPDAPDGDG
jgi:S-DNA-T family DNA segregation ATPase FtsK/SpoIIIE